MNVISGNMVKITKFGNLEWAFVFMWICVTIRCVSSVSPVIGYEGEAIEMPCRSDSSGTITSIQWSLTDPDPIIRVALWTGSGQPTYTDSLANGRATMATPSGHLTIHSLMTSDAGGYRCRVFDETYFQSLVVEYFLTVFVKPTNLQITGLSGLVTEGVSTSVQCTIGRILLPAPYDVYFKQGGAAEYKVTSVSTSTNPDGTKSVTASATVQLDKSDNGKPFQYIVRDRGGGAILGSTSVTMQVAYLPTSASLSLVGKSTADPIQAGVQVVYQCTTPDGNPAPILQIYRRSTAVSNTGSSPLSYTRTILDTDNQATFTCKATTTGLSGETTSSGITLTNVQFAPSAIFLSQSPSGPVRASSQDITLTCRTSSASNPAVTVAWQRVRGGATTIITAAAQTTTSTDTSNQGTNVISILTLSRPGKEYNGDQYNCLMTYKTSSPFQKSAVLNITYPPDRATAVGSPVTVTEGQTPGPILRCEFVDKGNPEAASFEWLHPGQTNVARTGLTYQTRPVSLTSAGTYQCRPYNSVGRGQAASIIVVVNAASYINTGPQNITVNESDVSVQLRCEARGKPVPSITWRFNSQLVSTQLYTVQNTSQVNSETQYDTVSSTLTLAGPGRIGNTVNRTDQGFYTCRANNEVGNTAEKTAYINVQYYGELNPDKITNREVALDIGTEAVLTLYVTANPVATVYTWTKQNGSLSTRSRQETNIERQEGTLRIPDLVNSDYGTYFCTVLNAAGVSQFVFTLEMTGKPGPPLDFNIVALSAISVTVEWTSNKDGGHVQTFVVFYKEAGGDWQTVIDIPDVGYRQPVRQKIENLRDNTGYIFKVEATNSAGSGGFSAELTVETKAKPIISQTDFSVHIEDQVATVTWSQPKGVFTSLGIQYCLKWTALQCSVQKVTNISATSEKITLPDGRQYDFYLFVYQGDDVVVTSLPFTKGKDRENGVVTDNNELMMSEKRKMSRNNEMEYESPLRIAESSSFYTGLQTVEEKITDNSPYADVQKRDVEIDRRNVKILEKIGCGAFGVVQKGEVFNLDGKRRWIAAAVKSPEDDPALIKDLLNELKVMLELPPHPNVVSLLGSCTRDGGTPLIITEYLRNGNLQDFLRNDRSKQKTVYSNLHGISSSLTSHELLKCALDVGNGMAYLSTIAILHRDLAARNILVSEDKTCKIF